MVKVFKPFSAFLSLSLLLLLSGCFGTTQQTVQPSAESVPIALPAAVPGNVAMAVGDEAPIISNEHGEPIRQDREANQEVVRFEGFNEE